MKGPARKTGIFTISGAVVLMACLLAGLAQAADNGNALQCNGDLITTIAPGTGQAPGSPAASDGYYACMNHVIRCFDSNDTLLGFVTNAPCYRDYLDGHTFLCENNYNDDLNRCRERYGNHVEYTTSLTECGG